MEKTIRELFGNIRDLKPGQLKVIKDVLKSRCAQQDIVSLSLLRRLSLAAYESQRIIGVLLDRKGVIRWLIVGGTTKLYLPDIGRLRAGKDRLRGLRLIIARPSPLNRSSSANKAQPNITLTHDFKTDLEKLRLDAVVEIDASKPGVDGPVVLGYLSVKSSQAKSFSYVTKEEAFRSSLAITQTFPQLIESIQGEISNALSANKQLATKGFSEQALVVGVYTGKKKEGKDSLTEACELARSARVDVVDTIIQWRTSINPKTVVGQGKLEEICLKALSLDIELLIFDMDLSPSQLFNITQLTDLKVLDRSMLILDIFAQRAVTREGKLQVEMAQLAYSLPRLAQKQTGLSRLTGGIGGRGPGETKLEVNKRRVKQKLARLSKELEKIKGQRKLRRKNRSVNGLPTIAIIGYTNAGKSTLLNSLSSSSIYAKDELFATLDPHSKRLRFPRSQEVIVTDTVGFISNLPKDLLNAFKATLEELNDADLLLHVVDISDENYAAKIKVVEDVLTKLSCDKKERLLVFNKVDLIKEKMSDYKKHKNAIYISAHTKKGLKELTIQCQTLLGSKQYNEKEGPNTDSIENEVIFDYRSTK